MEEDIKRKLGEIQDNLESAEWDLYEAKEQLNKVWDKLEGKANQGIKNIDSFKRELKRDGLYSSRMADFLENYMKFYNN